MIGNWGLNPLEADLDHILTHMDGWWEELRGKRIFITGGTGFFGCWLLESFVWANDKLGLGATAVVLTRNPETFRKKSPHLATRSDIRFLVGDICSFEFPEGEFSHIVHGATETSIHSNHPDRLSMFDKNVQGARRVLEFARLSGAQRFLLTSSGAAYGKQPPEMTHIPEDYRGAPETVDLGSSYGQGKRVSEFLCAAYAQKYGLEILIARCFAFAGPYLPMNANYAIANFIRDALQGGPIYIQGDGTPYRSYLYAADLVIWLWTILFKGKTCRPYNVGSDVDLTIAQLGQEVASVLAPGTEIRIANQPEPGKPTERYVPSTQRAQSELGLCQRIGLQDTIRRTGLWYSELT